MTYALRFSHADDVVQHLNGLVPTIADPLLIAKYSGFVSVVSVTVYELAIKQIFADFATKKNRVFGVFVGSHFSRINGRIKLKNLKAEHIARFGEKYVKRFSKNLQLRADAYWASHRKDVRSSYNNAIVWRHDYAHKGLMNTNATYQEVVDSYTAGKEVIHALADAMVR